jgi:hypothetical protein
VNISRSGGVWHSVFSNVPSERKPNGNFGSNHYKAESGRIAGVLVYLVYRSIFNVRFQSSITGWRASGARYSTQNGLRCTKTRRPDETTRTRLEINGLCPLMVLLHPGNDLATTKDVHGNDSLLLYIFLA